MLTTYMAQRKLKKKKKNLFFSNFPRGFSREPNGSKNVRKDHSRVWRKVPKKRKICERRNGPKEDEDIQSKEEVDVCL